MVSAWAINLVHRRFATVLGIAATALGCAYAIAVKKGWLGAARSGFVAAEDAEKAAAEMGSAVEILTVAEAIEMREMYRSSTLVALRVGEPARLPGGARARRAAAARTPST